MSALSAKKFYPVIHCIDPFERRGVSHAGINARIATENGADGIFLIGHGLSYMDIFRIYEQVRTQFPSLWIGINFLDLASDKKWSKLSSVAMGCPNINALWVDDIPYEKLNLPSTIQVFGGVAFKYINPLISGKELETSCKIAIRCVDIATTSGNKTGSAPDIAKLEAIKKNLAGEIPLALASGISSENVLTFKPTVDIFLVASSICEKKESSRDVADYLVPEKVKWLAELIHK